jgi:hypothetical protein
MFAGSIVSARPKGVIILFVTRRFSPFRALLTRVMARRAFKFEDEDRQPSAGFSRSLFASGPTSINDTAPAHLISSAGEDDWDSISRVKSSTVGAHALYKMFLVAAMNSFLPGAPFIWQQQLF